MVRTILSNVPFLARARIIKAYANREIPMKKIAVGKSNWTARNDHIPKVKIGTILEEDVVRKLKERSLQERRPQNEIIQEALYRYLASGSRERELRKAAVAHFCSRPFHLSPREIHEIMEEDYYEQ
jgi:hypothetical protein